jgi:hypothetical protein
LTLAPGKAGKAAMINLMKRTFPLYFPNPKQAPPAGPGLLAGLSAKAYNSGTMSQYLTRGSAVKNALAPQTPVLVGYGSTDTMFSKTRQQAVAKRFGVKLTTWPGGHFPGDGMMKALNGFYGSMAPKTSSPLRAKRS